MPQRDFFNFATVEDAKSIKSALERQRLTQKWLLYRLDVDYGVQISASELSELFDGKRPIGKKTSLVIRCAEQIIKEYEDFYRKG